MKRFQIINGVLLRSTNTSLQANSYYTAANDKEEAELVGLCANGTCREMVQAAASATAAAPVEAPVNATDDLGEVPGVGKTTLDKLTKAGITTKSQLKDALAKRADEMKDVLGMNFDKVSKYFADGK